jgi:hypothetical protein
MVPANVAKRFNCIVVKFALHPVWHILVVIGRFVNSIHSVISIRVWC